MQFTKKDEDGEMWSVNWGDEAQYFLCMTDHPLKADIIINTMQFVTNRSPNVGDMLENVRDPE
jgi:hypothetical protein